MKEFIKRTKITSIVFCLLYLMFGISLIVWPNTTKLTIVILLGSLLILHGIINIVNYFLYGYEPFGFTTGIINIAMGILICCCANALSSPTVFALIFGFTFIFNALGRLQNSFDYRRFGSKTWWLDSIFALIILALGITIVTNPFASEKYLLIFLGISIICDSITHLITICVLSGKIKKVKHTISDLFKREISPENVIDITDYNKEQ